MNLLVTGGAGFIGSNFVKMVLREHPDVKKVTVLDTLTYCGNLDNFDKETWKNERFSFCQGNILDKDLVFNLIKTQDMVVHFAAFTHIDRSIDLADPFIDTDFKGTFVLLEAIRRNPIKRFVQISTSEVYGSYRRTMDEEHPIAPQSPYAASKAGADRLVYSYWATYKLPVVVVRPFNAYGPHQYPEKLIPFFISRAIEDKELLIYGDGKNTRDWTYVSDTVRGIWEALQTPGIEGEAINLGSGEEVDVLTISKIILDTLNKPSSLVKFISDRPGHVKKLLADYSKAINMLNWEAKVKFEDGISQTIKWYIENKWWWEKIKSKPEYKEFENEWYGKLKK
ncbi:MAG: dTDP-glucose 4,6-dehydratase [Candidatus Stahlbacteria bacterium]|nr:dTDP-glucose 4,6-dehydratase [Candidatus Stahlbacteria bacterium]